jgi:sec-independent protein translocase protein TatA
MPFGVGPGEIILVLLIALIVLGPSRLPEVGSALGKSIREFRKASSDLTEATRVDASPLPPATSPTAAPAPTPEPISVTPTAPAVPAPVPMPQAPGDDETDPTP